MPMQIRLQQRQIIIMIQQQVKQQEHQQTIHQLMMQMINRQLITILV